MIRLTFKNYFCRWVRIWPVTIILVIAGLGAGILLANRLTQSYKGSMSILVVNDTIGTTFTDYTSIMNSVIVKDEVKRRVNIDSCSPAATNLGNVVTVSADCVSVDDSQKVLSSALEVFDETMEEIYGSGAVSVTVLSEVAAEKTVSNQDGVVRVGGGVLAGFAVSLIVAFVLFDLEASRTKKK